MNDEDFDTYQTICVKELLKKWNTHEYYLPTEGLEELKELKTVISKYASDKNITDEQFGRFVRNCIMAGVK
jgi:hypothetical protein